MDIKHDPLLNISVVSATEYHAKLLRFIRGATRRVVIAAMLVRSGPKVSQLLDAAIAAQRRGVKVHIVTDVFCQHANSRPDYLTARGFRHECNDTRESLNTIQRLGGRVDWLGRMGMNPYAGRYHPKVTIVDDHAFSFGGINLTDDSLKSIDYMLYAHDAALAEQLVRLVGEAANGRLTADIHTGVDARNTLLYDSGIRGKSIIYDTACALASRARRIVYVSQMCPSGRLAEFIKRTNNTCYFNRPGQTGLRPDSAAQLWDNWRSGIENNYAGVRFVHAKFILFELNDGTKAVLSGSHNFSWRGVAFGTQEIALHSTDMQLYKRLHDVVYAVATADGKR